MAERDGGLVDLGWKHGDYVGERLPLRQGHAQDDPSRYVPFIPPSSACFRPQTVQLTRTLYSRSFAVGAVVTIGLSLTIPFAIALDLVRGTSTGGFQSLLGAGFVLASFGFMGVEGAKEGDELVAEGDVERGRRRGSLGSDGTLDAL